jgi:predicted metalloprotease with PDZ domain
LFNNAGQTVFGQAQQPLITLADLGLQSVGITLQPAEAAWAPHHFRLAADLTPELGQVVRVKENGLKFADEKIEERFFGIEVGKVGRSLRVTHVAKGSPAEKAGISKGVIFGSVKVGDDRGGKRNILTVEELRQAVGHLKPGDQIEIGYLDDDYRLYRAKITLGKRP